MAFAPPSCLTAIDHHPGPEAIMNPNVPHRLTATMNPRTYGPQSTSPRTISPATTPPRSQ